jgi:hypothetical protein
MKFVTVTIGGITQSVPEADVALYLRAGYSVVDEKSAPVEPVAPTDPAPVEPAPAPEKAKKSDK